MVIAAVMVPALASDDDSKAVAGPAFSTRKLKKVYISKYHLKPREATMPKQTNPTISVQCGFAFG